MVIYRLEPHPEAFWGPWVVVAVLGNDLTWEVGRYQIKEKALERIMRMEQMVKADAPGGLI